MFHKDGIEMNFEKTVRDLIAENRERVHFLNWGNHHATNKFGDVPNVILAGTLFYRPSYYEALARLVADRRPAQGAIDDAMFDDVMLGEHRHLVLQALCRGSVRRCQGAECAPCNAYIIATTRSGIPAALCEIFPGCRVVRWQLVQKALSGKVKEAAEFVIKWFEKNPEGCSASTSCSERSEWTMLRTSRTTCAAIPTSRKRSRITTSQKPRCLVTTAAAS